MTGPFYKAAAAIRAFNVKLTRLSFVFARNVRILIRRDPPADLRPNHLFRRGFHSLLRRSGSSSVTRTSPPAATRGACDGITGCLLSPADQLPDDKDFFITRFMYYIWQSRPDLKTVFHLQDKASRVQFCKWFLLEASREYGLSADAYPDELLAKLSTCGGVVARRARSVLDEKGELALRRMPAPGVSAPNLGPQVRPDGSNLVGYFRGEFGMGELARTVVRAFGAARIPVSVIDCSVPGLHGSADNSVDCCISGTQLYRTNIFNINADVLPSLCFRLGEPFFSGHYNVGYWAWELSKCPPEFDLAFSMIDEVWAISEFVTGSLRTRSPVPVLHMPLAVSVPILRQGYSKAHFGLREDSFAFIFTFDAASYLARKNPIAVVRAFKLAFPRGDERVQLLLKTMNAPISDPLWPALTAEARTDSRIMIMSSRLRRDEVLGLNSVCDAFVSLHRAEGFGISLAEAMLLGKPLVATNYSGSRDFAREGTACLVDYELVPVSEGFYPFCQDQVWAEPDIGHAAVLMRRLVHDDHYREDIALAGQRFVQDNFNETTIGARYAARLQTLQQNNFKTVRSDQSVTDNGAYRLC